MTFALKDNTVLKKVLMFIKPSSISSTIIFIFLILLFLDNYIEGSIKNYYKISAIRFIDCYKMSAIEFVDYYKMSAIGFTMFTSLTD